MSSRWKERNAKTRKDRKCEDENSCQSEEGAIAWDRQLCLGQSQWTLKGWRQPQEIQPGEEGAKGRVRLLRVHGSAELREVASSSATQGLRLGDRKVGYQVSNKDQS